MEIGDKRIPALTQLSHYIERTSPENHLVLFMWEPTTIIILNIAVV